MGSSAATGGIQKASNIDVEEKQALVVFHETQSNIDVADHYGDENGGVTNKEESGNQKTDSLAQETQIADDQVEVNEDYKQALVVFHDTLSDIDVADLSVDLDDGVENKEESGKQKTDSLAQETHISDNEVEVNDVSDHFGD